MLSSGSSKLAVSDPTIAYAAAKAAMDAVSRNLAAAWSVQYGITVNSISVGKLSSPFKSRFNGEVVRATGRVHYLGRIRSPSDRLEAFLTVNSRFDRY